MQSMKEASANIAAAAQAGLDKTKATMEEKMERMKTTDPNLKQMATDRKEEKILDAELHKQEVLQNNAAARQAGTGTWSGTA